MFVETKTTTGDKMIKKVFVCGAPLLLAFLELFHPHGFGSDVYGKLTPFLNIWLFIHTAQLLLFLAVAVVFFLLIENIRGPLAFCVRVAIAFFVVFYTAFDSIAGLGTGILIRIGQGFPPEQQDVIQKIIQLYYFEPELGGSHSWLSEIASLAALLSVWGVALVLWRNHYPKVPLLIYALAGPVLWHSHAYPYGPVAFGLIGFANIWISVRRNLTNS